MVAPRVSHFRKFFDDFVKTKMKLILKMFKICRKTWHNSEKLYSRPLVRRKVKVCFLKNEFIFLEFVPLNLPFASIVLLTISCQKPHNH